jgi:hypothetical protein
MSQIKLTCVHRGGDGDEILYYSTYDEIAQSWSIDASISGGRPFAQSASAPSLAIHKGKTFCVYRGSRNDNVLHWVVYDPATGQWSGDRTFPNTNASDGGPCIYDFNDTLYCVHFGVDTGDLFWCVYDDASSWTSDSPFTNGNMSDAPPALIEYNDQLYCVHKGANNEGLWWSTYAANPPAPGDWTEDARFDQGNRSRRGPAVGIDANGTLHCVHRGDDNSQGLWSCSFDGNNWGQDTPFSQGNTSADNPAIASFRGLLWCVHRGKVPDSNLYWTMSSDGVNWTADKQFTADNTSLDGPAVVAMPWYGGFTPAANTTYKLVNKHSGQVADVSQMRTDPGAPVVQFPYHSTSNEQWTITDHNTGYYTLAPVSGSANQLVLDNNNSADSGTPIIQWNTKLTGIDSQLWELANNNDNTYRIVNKMSGYVLDVQGASPDPDAPIIQWPWKGTDNQRWTILPVTPT